MSLSSSCQIPADSIVCCNSDVPPQEQTQGASVSPKDSQNKLQSGVLTLSAVTSNVEPDKDESFADVPSWRPFWLGDVRLICFCFWFLCWTVALPIMLHYSQLNHGLVTSRIDLAYLWRFGPTAICTVVALLWSRVELQALIYMPWVALYSKQPVSPEECRLDYASMIVPTVLVQSLRRRHYFVFLVSLLSIILKVHTVLSPALFYLGDEKESQRIQLKVLSSFNTASDRVNNVSSGAYYSALAIRDTGMELPFGVGKECAYQTFERSGRNNHPRGTIDEPLEAIVDGLFMDIKCLQLEDWSATRTPTGVQTYGNWTEGPRFNFTIDLQFENCDQTITVKQDTFVWTTSAGGNSSHSWPSYLDRNGTYIWRMPADLESRPCSSLPQQHPQTLYYVAHYGPSSQNDSLPEIDTMGGVICSPTAWVSKVRVIDDGVSPNVTVAPNQDNTTVDFNAWTLLTNSIPAESFGSWAPSNRADVYSENGPVEADRIFWNEEYSSRDPTLVDSKVLRQSISNFTEILGPLLAHFQLRQEEESEIGAEATQVLLKVKISPGVCISIASMFGLSLCISVWALLKSRRIFSGWFRNPGTMLGSMVFLNNRHAFEYASHNQDKYKASWADCDNSPLVFKLWFRLLFTVYVLALVVGLISTLKISQLSDGLANVGEENDLFVWWKIVPTFSMLLVALYTSFSSFSVREISNLSGLTSKPCSTEELDTSVLDMIGFRALYQSLRLKNYTVTLLQSLSILCAFLTALSAPLFTPEVIPENRAFLLPEESWFGTRPLKNNTEEYEQIRKVISTMFFTPNASNYTYPPFTYSEMLFPRLGANLSEEDWGSGKEVKVITPAAKIASACVRIPDDEFKLNVTTMQHHKYLYYGINITQSLACPNGSLYNPSAEIWFSEETEKDGVSYFADNVRLQTLQQTRVCNPDTSDEDIQNSPWRTLSLFWGKFSTSNREFEHKALWTCNYTWGEINTEINLVQSDGKILIGRETPPKQIDSYVRPWNPPFPVLAFETNDPRSYSFYNYISKGSNPQAYGLDGIFTNLVPPYGSLNIEAFGNPDQENEILEMVRSNYALLNVQISNVENRLDIHEESTTTPFQHEDGRTANVTIVDHNRQRLVQNPAITITMVVILCLVLAVHAWGLVSLWLKHYMPNSGWLLDLEFKGLAPDGFNSIAMMDSLMRGSNCFDHMPKDAYRRSPSELYEILAGVRFRMGWFQRAECSEKEFALGALDDEAYTFLGPK